MEAAPVSSSHQPAVMENDHAPPDAPRSPTSSQALDDGGGASAAPRSALQTTLGVASTAANLVLFPYVFAGRAAYQATSFAVTAPIKVTKHVASSLSGSWQQQTAQVEESSVDLFGEREVSVADAAVEVAEGDGLTTEFESPGFGDDEQQAVIRHSTHEVDDIARSQPSDEQLFVEEVEATVVPVDDATPGMVSQLILLPVRLVSSTVSHAAALPASAISYGGRTLSGAVSSSQSLASSALVASGGLVLRTSRNVAHGITRGAFSTAHRVTGLVGSSVGSVSYAIPPSVANALWQGMERTGSVSTSVVSYAIAVPAYRMAQVLVPQIDEYFTEQQCVDTTKDGVKLLVKTLGPQNAFYVLRYMYEIVNSEEVQDAFLLCQDLLRESLDAENYKKIGSTVTETTGVEKLVPVVKEIYNMVPSLEELVDVAVFFGDVAEEILDKVSAAQTARTEAEVVDSGRFEYVWSDEDAVEDSDCDLKSESGRSTASGTDSEYSSTQEVPAFAVDTFEAIPERVDEEAAWSEGFASATDARDSAEEDPFENLYDSGVSYFSSVLDSQEAATLFNTFGDFLDVLVE